MRLDAALEPACALVAGAGMDQQRSLRSAVRDLRWQRQGEGEVVLEFHLARGAYATALLRELFTLSDYLDSST